MEPKKLNQWPNEVTIMSLLSTFLKWVDHEIGLDRIDLDLEKGDLE